MLCSCWLEQFAETLKPSQQIALLQCDRITQNTLKASSRQLKINLYVLIFACHFQVFTDLFIGANRFYYTLFASFFGIFQWVYGVS